MQNLRHHNMSLISTDIHIASYCDIVCYIVLYVQMALVSIQFHIHSEWVIHSYPFRMRSHISWLGTSKVSEILHHPLASAQLPLHWWPIQVPTSCCTAAPWAWHGSPCGTHHGPGGPGDSNPKKDRQMFLYQHFLEGWLRSNIFMMIHHEYWHQSLSFLGAVRGT